MEPSDWTSLGALAFAFYSAWRTREHEKDKDAMTEAYKTLDNRVTRDHEVLLLRLGEDSTRAVELFKRRLDLVGPLWRAVMGVRDASRKAFNRMKLSPAGGPSHLEVEQAQLNAVREAVDHLIEAWDPASPIMKEVRADVDQMIEETNQAMKVWSYAINEELAAQQMSGPGRKEAIVDANQSKRETAKWTKDELPKLCEEILHKLTTFVDARVAEVEASALPSGSTQQLRKYKADDIQGG